MTEQERLTTFLQRVQELLGTRLVQSGGLRTSFNLNFAQNRSLEFATHQPDEDDLRSFLLTFRQFVSEQEPVFARRIAKVLWSRLDGDTMREQLSQAGKRYTKALKQGNLALVVDDQRFPPDTVLDLWINGLYFHNDERKAQALRALDPLSQVFVRHVFLDVLVDATKYYVFLADVTDIAVREGLL